jgi:3-isopropylmalate/(R)-2-methylmalate dehydratase small subunit
MPDVIISGKVWKFGDNINTDLMYPSQYLHLPPPKVKEHTFEALRPDFYKIVQPGDIIVAGKNFGCGSSREGAAQVLKELGIGACLAESMARIHFRNCIAVGLPVLTQAGISKEFDEGDKVTLNVVTGEINNLTSNKAIKIKPLPKPILDILNEGGLMPRILKIARDGPKRAN